MERDDIRALEALNLSVTLAHERTGSRSGFWSGEQSPARSAWWCFGPPPYHGKGFHGKIPA